MARPPRLAADAYIGIREHFLTFCTRGRLPHFSNAKLVDLVRTQFLRAAGRESFEILVYCFMPDHVHLLVVGNSEQSDLRRFARQSKQLSSYHVAREAGMRLWQDSFYDHVLRTDEARAAERRSREELLEFVGTACRT